MSRFPGALDSGFARKQNARWIEPPGILFWRRPTLARPVAVLPSGLQRFTSVFGMGTGGTTALLSPEIRAGLALEPHWRFRCVRSDASADADLWRRRAIEVNCPYLNFSKNMLDR